jgi:CrcB protein
VCGSLLRWILAHIIPSTAAGLPWPTLVANVAGCFVIGFYAALTGPDGRVFVGPRVRQSVMTGFCGGLTTFSALSLETFTFAAVGDLRSAALYLSVSLAASLAAVWLGDALAAHLNSLRRT